MFDSQRHLPWSTARSNVLLAGPFPQAAQTALGAAGKSGQRRVNIALGPPCSDRPAETKTGRGKDINAFRLINVGPRLGTKLTKATNAQRTQRLPQHKKDLMISKVVVPGRHGWTKQERGAA